MPASAAADALMGFLLSRRLLLCVLHTQALQVALRPSGYLIHLMKAVLALSDHTVPENRFQEIVRETLMPHMVQ